MEKRLNKKVVAIIQARMGSTRFPGKILERVNSISILGILIKSLLKSKSIDELILAIPDGRENFPLLNEARIYGIKVFQGSENDVLDRFYNAAKKEDGKIIVRLTGDCPLHDSKIIDQMISQFKNEDIDYLSNVHPPTYPDGLDVEIFSFEALESAWKNAKATYQREHVTPYIWERTDQFKIKNFELDGKNFSHMRWTIDEKKDFLFIQEILNNLGENEITFENILKVLEKFPKLNEINFEYLRNEGFTKSLKEEDLKKFGKSLDLLSQAKKIIPTASQTYSKSSNYFCEGAAPAFLEKGDKGHVWDVDGNEFIDFVCALGPVTIGYNNEQINRAIINQLEKGISFSLPTELEIKLSKKLTEIIPSAEMVKFFKNGSDVTTAAVRLARAYTKKEIIAYCGYHGCHDWYVGTTDNNLGVPESTKLMTKRFDYNNIDSLKKIFEENKEEVSAVILEPCQGDGPENNFLEKVKELTHKNNAILIFDEVVSGFRVNLGGAQKLYNVIPDLSCFGKGMGNGVSISVLTGKKEIMKLIDEGVFLSTTFGGETLGLVASLETIKLLENPKNFSYIIDLGNKWKSEVQSLINSKKLNEFVKVSGVSPHCGVVFSNSKNLDAKDLFSVYQQTLIDKGILSVGINNFCLEHTEEDINKFISAVNLALDAVKQSVLSGRIDSFLRGKKFSPIFKR